LFIKGYQQTKKKLKETKQKTKKRNQLFEEKKKNVKLKQAHDIK